MARHYGEYVICVWLITLWTLITVVYSDKAVNSSCYCLIEELSNLRNPIHVEATIIRGDSVYLVAEQIGVIWQYRPESDGSKLTLYLNVSNLVLSKAEIMDEHGLLGFALHPNFRENKKIFLHSIRTMKESGVGKRYAVISEITGHDVKTEKVLMYIEQPGTTRNGGQLLFGQDGYLYIFVGDGGPGSNLDIQSQNGSSLLGKVLRIDIDKYTMVDFRRRFYDIPPDNPKQNGWRPEVYAMGSRNMWRCGLDRGDINGKGRGRIFCGDLGSSIADEVNEIKIGADYGWPLLEGNTCFNNDLCKDSVNVPPLFEYRRDIHEMTAIVGGPLYRQTRFPELYGNLVVGDFSSGRLYTLKETIQNTGNTVWNSTSFPRCDVSRCGCNARGIPRAFLLSLGETHTGELLLLMTDEPAPNRPRGAILRLEPPVGDNLTCNTANIVPTTLLHLITMSYIVFISSIFIL